MPLPALLLAGLLACGALAAMIGSDAPAGRPGRAPAAASASSSEGSLAISNSRAGSAILSASGMAPGSVVSGTVAIANTGTAAGRFKLSEARLTETPGTGGGLLSGRLQLLVEDVTGGAATPLYYGPLADLGSRPLGRYEPGARRTYRFTVSFPEGAAPADDNALQSAALSVRYDWSASGRRSAAVPRLSVRTVRAARVFSRRSLLLSVGCSERCSVRVRGTLRAGRSGGVFRLGAMRRRVATGRTTLIGVPISRRAVAAAYGALRGGGRVKIALTVTARGASGGTAVNRRRLILVPAR